MARIKGKIALITGATAGIGEAVALRLAEEGAHVFVSGRNEKAGHEVVAEIAKANGQATFLPLEVAEEEDWRRALKLIEEAHGRLDILVSNAGITMWQLIEDTALEDWQRIMAVNVDGVFLGTKHVIPLMRRGGGGSIVNIFSVAAYCGLPHIAAYSATKGALATFTKNCANGLLHDTIRVNGIMLGWTDTPNEDVVQKQQGSPDDWLSIGEEASPFGRLLKPYDVAKLTCFLLSSDSGVMTGSLIDQAQRIIGTLSMPDNITGKDV